MGAIFLSYAREDRSCAERLARTLAAAGHDVWWDRRLDSGEEFSDEIEAALEKAEVVLVAWSKDSIRSRWVRDEAAVGGESGRLVPVSIDGSLPPMGFRQFHTLDLTGWKSGRRDERTAEFLRSVDRRLGVKQGRPPAVEGTSPSRVELPASKRTWAALAVLLLVAAVGATVLVWRAGQGPEGPLKPKFALLPFTTASPDPALRELASQARDSIAHTFAQSGLPVRLIDETPADGSKSVDFLITADISRSAGNVLATVRLNEAAGGMTVYSDRFKAEGNDVRNLPERMGAQMAGNLTWAFPLLVLDRRKPIEPALLAEILQGADFSSGLENLQGYQIAKRVAAKAPDLHVAQSSAAFGTAFALSAIPRVDRGQALAEARQASDRAVMLEPGFGDYHASWCMLHSETRIVECEDRLRAGRRMDPDAPFLNTFLSHLMRNVGRFEESMELARLAHAHDTYVPTKIGWMLKSLQYGGEEEAARELYEQGVRWWPEFKLMYFRNRMLGLIENGDFEAMVRLEREIGPEDLPPGHASSAALVAALKAKSVPAARRACPDTDAILLSFRCMIALAMLGDQDGAYKFADKFYPKRVGRSAAETETIWLDEPNYYPLALVTSPAAAPMRRDPRYLRLAERVGLLAYWRLGRVPDFCRKDPEPICEQLKKRR